VIAPTRELSVQIFEVLTKLLKPFHWIVPGILIGGEKRKSEKARIRKGSICCSRLLTRLSLAAPVCGPIWNPYKTKYDLGGTRLAIRRPHM